VWCTYTVLHTTRLAETGAVVVLCTIARSRRPPHPSPHWAVDVSTDANPSYLAPAPDSRERNRVTMDPGNDSSPDNTGSSEPRSTRTPLPTRATVTCARNGRCSGLYQPPAASAS